MSDETMSMVIDSTPTQRAPVYRLGPNGQPTKIEPADDDPNRAGRKVVPPKGTYTLRVDGISEPRKEANKFHDPSDPRSQPFLNKTWFEFEIVRGKNLNGRWFSNKWTWSTNEQATMGKFIRAMLGDDPPAQFNTLALIGRTFEAMVNPKSATYAELLVDTVMPADLPEQADQPQAITASQRSKINAASRKVWETTPAALANLNMYLLAAYNVTSLDALSYGDADAVLYELETVPDEVKEVIKQAMAATEDYADTPELVQ